MYQPAQLQFTRIHQRVEPHQTARHRCLPAATIKVNVDRNVMQQHLSVFILSCLDSSLVNHRPFVTSADCSCPIGDGPSTRYHVTSVLQVDVSGAHELMFIVSRTALCNRHQ